MENLRIQFSSGKQMQFLEEVVTKSKLSIKELADMARVHPRSFLDWRKEKLRMSLYAFEKFSTKFNVNAREKKEVLIKKWKTAQKQANRVGGNTRYKKYGIFATKEGRKKGGIRAIATLRERGIIPKVKSFNKPKRSVKLAEFVGIMLGDGCITPGLCSVTLNGEADASYVQYVQSFCEALFTVRPKLYKRKESKAVVIYYNGVQLIQFLILLGLHIGSKVRQQVGVPKWVTENKEYSIACLRGLMDTDGGVFLHKYKVNNKQYNYKQACFTNRSTPLIMFVNDTLNDLGFHPKLRENDASKKVWLYNEAETKQYLQLVGSHNYRLRKFGEVA